MVILSKNYKKSKLASVVDLPKPLQNHDDFEKFNHRDLEKMSDLEMRCEQQRALLALTFLEKDRVIYIDPTGAMITASEWLEERLAEIAQRIEKNLGLKQPIKPAQAHGRADGWS